MSEPLPFFLLPLHVVEHPVPDDQEAGDDNVGQEPCAQECPDNDKFGVHGFSPSQASAATVSAQVSTFVLIASSSYEVRLIWSRPSVIM